MAWFKVDDGFYSHAKVLTIPRAVRALAVGTWVLCGTWSANKLTDGKIPAHMVDELGGSEDGAQALVDVGLWRRTKSGYVFVNWKEFQPTRAEVEATRKAERDRKAEYRQRVAKTKGKTGESPEGVPAGQNQFPETPSRSRPVPDPIDNSSTQNTEPKQKPVENEEELSTGDSYTRALAHVSDRLTDEAGRSVSRLEAGVVVDWIVARSKKPPVSIERYVKSALTRDWPIWTNYIHSGVLPE